MSRIEREITGTEVAIKTVKAEIKMRYAVFSKDPIKQTRKVNEMQQVKFLLEGILAERKVRRICQMRKEKLPLK